MIRAIKDVNPNVLFGYHSCGYIEPFIPDLIDAGADILNPIQPECMSVEKIHAEYGGRFQESQNRGAEGRPAGTFHCNARDAQGQFAAAGRGSVQ